MYKKCYAEYAGKNQYKIHLWEENDYKIIPYRVPAYIECPERDAEYQGLKGEWLKKTYNWDKDNPHLHFNLNIKKYFSMPFRYIIISSIFFNKEFLISRHIMKV